MAMNTELEALQHVLADPAHGYFFDRWRAVKRLTQLASTTNGAGPQLTLTDARAVIDGLVAGLESVHWGVHRRCKRALETLTSQPLIDAVCGLIIEREILRLRDIAVTARYEPEDPPRKAAYLFVLGRQQFYEAHDPTGELLVQGYAATSLAARDHLLGLAHTRDDLRLALLTVHILERPRQVPTSGAEITVVLAALKTPGFCLMHDPDGALLAQFYSHASPTVRAQIVEGHHEWGDPQWARLIVALLSHPPRERSTSEDTAIRHALGTPGFYTVHDPTGEQLVQYYTEAGAPERAQMLQAVRTWEPQRGAQFVLGLLQPHGWASLSDAEQAVGVQMLSATQHADKVWALVQEGPLSQSWQAARKLIEGQWQPREARAVACWADLVAAVAGVADPMTVESLVGQQRAVLKGHTDWVWSVAFSPDGTTLASGSRDDTVRLWDVAQGQQRAVLQGHTNMVASVAFGPDGTTLASGNVDRTVRLWDVARGQQRAVLSGHTDRVHSVAFSPDGTTLVSGSDDHTVRLWDVARGQERAVLSGHTDSVWSVAFSPDGTTLASGSVDHTVRLWDVARGQARAVLSGHTSLVYSVAFSPDGTTLASGSLDDTVCLWDVARGQARAVLQGHTTGVESVAFSPDGTTLASGSYYDYTVRLWDVAQGQARAVLQGHGVRPVAFSPDGTTLAGMSEDRIYLWDVARGQQRAVLQGHKIESFAFSPDGTTLASGSWDRTVRLWVLNTRRFVEVLLGQMTASDVELAQHMLAAPSASAEQQAVARYVAAVLRYRLDEGATK
ncbi:MAG: WD40 repeat domain-containing protein [Deltaproteobacteria bacterium]|nr:WD40 repeat domain-containing protein [Deltaproteobacteria bacterium]